MYREYSQNAQIEHGYIWSEKDIAQKEEIFESVYARFYTERFCKKMFPEGEKTISHAMFIQNFTLLANHFDMNNI